MEKISYKTDNILDMSGIEVIDNSGKDYVILVEKENGAWTTLNKSSSHLIEKVLKQNISFSQYQEEYPNDTKLLSLLFNAGVLKINNKTTIKKNQVERGCMISQSKACQIVIRYTKKCNLSCSYCYAYSNDKKFHSMSNDTVMHILNKMSETYPDKIFNLSIHGGEPLLRYKDMISLVNNIKQKFPHVNLYIQTNGTLVTKEVARFLKDENFNVGLSIDGFDQETNYLRCQNNGRSSLNKSLIGLENLISAGITPGLFTVVTSANQYQLLEHFDFYVKRGIKKFNFCPIIPAGKAVDSNYEMDIDHLVSTYKQLIERINMLNSKCEDPDEYISEMNSTNIFNNLTSYVNMFNLCTISPCGAGRTLIAFDTDGSIYPCDDFVGEPRFKIGNVFEIEDIKKIVFRCILNQGLLNRDINNVPECSICPWKKICIFQCASDPYYTHQTFNKPHSMCTFAKKVIPEMIDLLYTKQVEPMNIIPC